MTKEYHPKERSYDSEQSGDKKRRFLNSPLIVYCLMLVDSVNDEYKQIYGCIYDNEKLYTSIALTPLPPKHYRLFHSSAVSQQDNIAVKLFYRLLKRCLLCPVNKAVSVEISERRVA